MRSKQHVGSLGLLVLSSLVAAAWAAGDSATAGEEDQKMVFPEKEWATADPDVIGLFGKGWDDLKTTTDEFVRIAREQTNARRRIIVSNEEDFFIEFQRRYGKHLPEVACSYGNEWDLYCASMAEVSAQVKRAVEKLRAAEAMATLVSLHQPGFMDGRAEARDRAFMDLGLYWEHDWTADGPISKQRRAQWQRTLARRIDAYVDLLHRDAAAELGRMIEGDSKSPRFFVFNPLGGTLAPDEREPKP